MSPGTKRSPLDRGLPDTNLLPYIVCGFVALLAITLGLIYAAIRVLS